MNKNREEIPWTQGPSQLKLQSAFLASLASSELAWQPHSHIPEPALSLNGSVPFCPPVSKQDSRPCYFFTKTGPMQRKKCRKERGNETPLMPDTNIFQENKERGNVAFLQQPGFKGLLSLSIHLHLSLPLS